MSYTVVISSRQYIHTQQRDVTFFRDNFQKPQKS